MGISGDLLTHLQSGHSSTCRVWKITRADGESFGFTDHDEDIQFDGITFKAGTGLSASSLNQSTGLAVDNGEAAGVLSDAAVSEADLKAGRFDGAEVTTWLVNWADVSQRALRFRGTVGEVALENGAFRADLRGLSEALNSLQGLVYQRGCGAQLGDGRCKVDLSSSAYRSEAEIAEIRFGTRFRCLDLGGFAPGWFENGSLTLLDGLGRALWGHVKSDRSVNGQRWIELWEEFRIAPSVGDRVRLVAGCDKRRQTCRSKFDNFLNFRGFPHIPGEDWLTAYPRKSSGNNGRSRYK